MADFKFYVCFSVLFTLHFSVALPIQHMEILNRFIQQLKDDAMLHNLLY